MKLRVKKLRNITGLILFAVIASSDIFCQPSVWEPRGVGGGGTLFFPTINPANDNEFYITCDMSPLFHSTDFGLSYTQVPFTKIQATATSTYEFTVNPDIAYCTSNTGLFTHGVRTSDGGKKWVPLQGNPQPYEDVYILKADYDNPRRLIIGYYGSIYISNDGGNSFSLIKKAADNNVGIQISGVFFDNDDVYVATNEGVFYSSDGGVSFSKMSSEGIPGNQVIFSFAGAKEGGVVRFFCITISKNDFYVGINPWDYWGLVKGVYSMDTDDGTWVSKMNGVDINRDFVMYVGMARNNINTVYLGGHDELTTSNSIVKTTDGGNTWKRIFHTINNQNVTTGWEGEGGDFGWGAGGSCFGIAVAPLNAEKVLFGDYSFIHKTDNGGDTWTQAYVSTADQHPIGKLTPKGKSYHSIGLENTSVWQIYWQDKDNMFAALTDIRGLRSKDGGVSWGFDYTGHNANTMYRIVKHNSNSTMFAATSNVKDMYQNTRLKDDFLDQFDSEGKIIYSQDNGAGWKLLHQFNHPVFWLATDPNDDNRLYASVIDYSNGNGDGGIWTTSDLNSMANSTWKKLPNPPRTQGHPSNIVVLNDGGVVCTYTARLDNNGVFTPSSGVFLYDPTARKWTDVSDKNMYYWTRDIVIDPADATQNTWYVGVFSGWGGAPNGKGGLYKTTDRGGTWKRLTGTQIDRVNSIGINPNDQNEAYITTHFEGLWRTGNFRSSSPKWTLVENYPFRQPEQVFFNPYKPEEVWITSLGSGMRVGKLPVKQSAQLVSFSGTIKEGISALTWTTVNETAGDYFNVEKSTDGKEFNSIGKVQGEEKDNNQHQWEDSTDLEVTYYRIKVTNSAGKIFYSKIVKLTQEKKDPPTDNDDSSPPSGDSGPSTPVDNGNNPPANNGDSPPKDNTELPSANNGENPPADNAGDQQTGEEKEQPVTEEPGVDYIRLKQNPVRQYALIEISSGKLERVIVQLFDFGGHFIMKQDRQVQKGVNQLQISIPSSLPKGIYALSVGVGARKTTFRILVID